MALTEVYAPELNRIGHRAWSGRRVFECPNTEVQAQITALWDTTYPGLTGRETAYAVRVHGPFASKDVSNSILAADYRTLTNDEYMERFASKGVVYTRGSYRSEPLILDKNGLVINGIDPTDPSGQTVWKIERGPDTKLRPQTEFVVHAHVTSRSVWVDQYADRLGMLNSTFMANIGQYGAGIGEVLFYNMKSQPNQHDKSKAIVDYAFLWSGERGLKWNELTVSRKWVKRALTVPVLDDAGADTGETKKIYGSVSTSVTRTAEPFESFNFTFIDGLCNW